LGRVIEASDPPFARLARPWRRQRSIKPLAGAARDNGARP